MQVIKNRLKHWRHKKEMNQAEFATFLGIAYTTYNTYENQTRQPGLITALQIAHKLGCTVDDVFFIEIADSD